MENKLKHQSVFELGPGETLAVCELLPGVKIKTLPNSWMPNAYAVKE
ncbi:MAG: hypothetical protein H6599_02800 [Flavobacteriales bacterium]|nr:hypothetical protein [Flavobacteriales bacterium]